MADRAALRAEWVATTRERERLDAELEAVWRRRAAVVAALRDDGMTAREVSAVLGLSLQRVSQLAPGRRAGRRG